MNANQQRTQRRLPPATRSVSTEHAPRSRREGHWLIGTGMATAVYPVLAFPGLQPQRALARPYADRSEVVQCGTKEFGTGMATAMSQVAADGLGIPLHRVRFELGDTELPNTSTAIGSAGAGMVSSAVHIAATALRHQLVARAIADARSPLHGAVPRFVLVGDGRMVLIDTPDRGETYMELLRRNFLEEVDALGSWTPPARTPGTRH